MDSLLSYQTLPLKIKSQLARITESWKAHAGENLVGVYLHGSVALGAFQPASGDLDVLVVVKDALTIETKLKIAIFYERSSKNPLVFSLPFKVVSQAE